MPTFPRGAKPSPPHVLAAAVPYQVVTAPAPQFGVVPPKLDYWDNDVDGVCVSSEEAFAKAWWSTYCGLPETFATAGEVRSFAAAHGWLNGATLTEVMDVMISEGMSIGGKRYMDGKYFSVDYSNELILQASIDPTDGVGGPSKIAIDADALPSGAGNQMGWFATKKGNFSNTDHCVSLSAYGRADFIYDQFKVSLPAGLSPSTPGYGLYTWKTIGFVTHDWLMGTCTESWARNPTTPGQVPSPTPTPIPPTPTPGTYTRVAGSVWFDFPNMNPGTIGKVLGSCKVVGPVPATMGADPSADPRTIPWQVIVWLLQYGPVVWAVVQADLKLGKKWPEIIADVLAVLYPRPTTGVIPCESSGS